MITENISSREEAEHFSRMKGSFYHTTVQVKRHVHQPPFVLVFTEPERIQIRISPSSDCFPRQWVASLHLDSQQHKQFRLPIPAASLGEAKTAGIRIAFDNNDLTADDADQLIWLEERWPAGTQL